MTSARAIAKTASIGLALGLVSAGLCAAAAGASLGLYLGSFAMATLLAPPLAAGERDRWSAFLATGAVIDGIAIVWLACVFASHTTFVQWLACYVVLIAYCLALMALARVLGVTITIVLAMAWLTWPVWLTPHISGAVAAWLTPAHPLLAVNRVLLDHGAWTQQPLMYQHTALGQDVAYTLPRTIWPCVILHLLIVAPAWWPGKSKGSSKEPGSMSAAAEC